MTVDELRTNDKVQEHKITDLEKFYEHLDKRIDRLENRIWAFMATVAGSVSVALIVAVFKP